MDEELNSGLPWVDALVNAHFRQTSPEERRRLLEEVEARTSEQTNLIWEAFGGGAPEQPRWEFSFEGPQWLSWEIPATLCYGFELAPDSEIDIAVDGDETDPRCVGDVRGLAA